MIARGVLGYVSRKKSDRSPSVRKAQLVMLVVCFVPEPQILFGCMRIGSHVVYTMMHAYHMSRFSEGWNEDSVPVELLVYIEAIDQEIK